MATLTAIYSEIQIELGIYTGFGRDPSAWTGSNAYKLEDIKRAIKFGLRQFYFPPPTTGRRHTWKFLYPTAVIETSAPYATGTIAVVANVAGSVVTLTGGTWPTAAGSGWRLRINDDSYDVLSRTNGTTLVLEDDDVVFPALTAFSLGQNRYELPADFLNFNGPLTYQSGTGDFYGPLDIVDEATLRAYEQIHTWTYRPLMAALVPKTLDAASAEPRQRWYLVFAPTIDAEYRFTYRYLHDPSMLDATNVNHWGGTPHSNTIILSCLAAAERMFNDGSTEMYQRFLTALSASIEFDRMTNAPDRLGCLMDPSDLAHLRWPTREEFVDWRRSVPTVEALP